MIIILFILLTCLQWTGLKVIQNFVIYLFMLSCGPYVYCTQTPYLHPIVADSTARKESFSDSERKTDWIAKCKLLFALDLRDIDAGMSVIDAIQDQCLPYVSTKGLFDYISAHAESIILLLDGFDEAPWLQDASLPNSNQFKRLLCKKWLNESCVIVTTRPHKVSTYIDSFRPCTQVELLQFSGQAVKEFIARFFNISETYLIHFFEISSDMYISESSSGEKPPQDLEEDVTKANSLLKRLLEKPKEWAISKIPILLTMICMLWKDDDDSLPDKTSEIYNEALLYIAKHNWVKSGRLDVDDDNNNQLETEVHETLISLGKVASKGLLEDRPNGRLVFLESDFEMESLEKGTNLGLVLRERTRSKRSV